MSAHEADIATLILLSGGWIASTTVRRAYFIHQKPIKAICREFRLSRKVVRNVIRSEAATAFDYERRGQPLPRIDPWREQLDALLLANEERPARERLTLVRVFEELVRLPAPTPQRGPFCTPIEGPFCVAIDNYSRFRRFWPAAVQSRIGEVGLGRAANDSRYTR